MMACSTTEAEDLPEFTEGGRRFFALYPITEEYEEEQRLLLEEEEEEEEEVAAPRPKSSSRTGYLKSLVVRRFHQGKQAFDKWRGGLLFCFTAQ